jgi:aminoglycoside phosphotransferase family enzyme/predicted kinase
MTPEENARFAELSAWFGGQAERTIETSCAQVFLSGNQAWKIKRPVDYGYLDYSTTDKRRWALERELRFNRLAAPDIYLRVGFVTREADGALALDGAGEVLEHVLEMRRFDENAVLAERPWAIDGDLADQLGRTTARFHETAELRDGEDGGALTYTVHSNARVLATFKDALGQEAVQRLIDLTNAALEKAKPLLARRGQAGLLRRCHGDLHLGNVLLENGAPVLFDCIEFNDALGEMDVLYDLGFLLMDLDFRRRTDAANRVLNAWLDETDRYMPQDHLTGLALLPLILSVRAGIRTHVNAFAGDLAAAQAYLAKALEHLEPKPASLIAIGGLSGTGKSTLARMTAPGIGGAPGAVVLRTDEVRKRLFGAGPLQKLGADAYSDEAHARVYSQMRHEAAAVLAAGRSVILDATFMDAGERAMAEALALEAGVQFAGVWLQSDPELLRQRVAARTGDASDADLAVLEAQLADAPPPPQDWTLVTDHDFDSEARKLTELLGYALAEDVLA